MINVVEPLKTFVLLKLPKPVFRLVAHISTIIGYTLAFSPIYLSISLLCHTVNISNFGGVILMRGIT